VPSALGENSEEDIHRLLNKTFNSPFASRVQGKQLQLAKGMMKLYRFCGSTEKRGLGSSVIEKLADDLQKAFPGIAGFSRLNLFRMRAFFLAYEKVSQAVTQMEEMPIFRISWDQIYC
jgi:hypothetical protein